VFVLPAIPLLLPLILLLLIAPVQVQVGKTQVQRGVLGDGLKARYVDAVGVVVGAKAEV
jgi:hypothetical protein